MPKNFYAGMLVRHALNASEARAFVERLTRLPFKVALTLEMVATFDSQAAAKRWLSSLPSGSARFSIVTRETTIQDAPHNAPEAWESLLAEPYWIDDA